MATGLRAFLMIRSLVGSWSVVVHRDLEAILDQWKARENPKSVVGVLHVGFDRPPSHAFEELAHDRGGLMLLTASAKYALPADFAASKRPVGTVDSLPVFVGLRGWGYLIADAEVAEPSSNTGAEAQMAEPSGWVRDFLSFRSDLTAQVTGANIHDDESYLQNEHLLPFETRRDIGISRYRRLLKGNEDDPCAMACAAPPWLAIRQFHTMSLSVRAANVFSTENIIFVSDLARYDRFSLLKTQNFGRTSLADVVQRLNDAIQQGPYSIAEKIMDAADTTLLAGIRRSLLNYTDREQDIIRRRMGLDCVSETLQEIGDDHDITRERIRQIESKVLKRLRREEFWDDVLSEKLTALLDRRNIPLPLMGVEAADPWFAGVTDHPTMLPYILANICNGQPSILKIEGMLYFTFLSQEKWESTFREAKRLLESNVSKGWTRSYSQSLIEALLPQSSSEFRRILWDMSSRLCQFADANVDGELIAYGHGAEQVVEAILWEAEAPLHFSEIGDLAKARGTKDFDVRRLHNAAAAVGILLGRGTFGSDRHLPISLEEMKELALEAEEVISDGPARQWHTSEIRAALMEKGSNLAPSCDKYVLDNALARFGGLERHGRMIWSLKSDDSGNIGRIELRQAILHQLQEAGRPLRTEELRQRLTAVRGVNSVFQITSADPLIRVGAGLWGLNDRDVPIKRQDQPALLDGLVEILRERGDGVHTSELAGISNVLAGLSPSVIFSLASGDSRLKINQGHYLYLSEWGGPRRKSVSEATEMVLAQAAGPLHFDEIVDAVRTNVRRQCDRTAVSACLQGLEAVHDPVSGQWSAAQQEREFSDEAA